MNIDKRFVTFLIISASFDGSLFIIKYLYDRN